MEYSFCSDNFKAQPYWWDETPIVQPEQVQLPEKTDVLVIGAGYTGLNCGLQTAKAGRHTVVIDAEDAGGGCSTRNGGQISGEIKPDYAVLSRRFGKESAFTLIKEARGALDWLGDFVDQQGIECEFQQCGRFVAAHSPRQFQKLVAYARNQPVGLEQELQLVEARDQASEIDSEYYHGGLLLKRHCSLDPAKYHAGLMNKVRENGAQVISHCKAIEIRRSSQGFAVSTSCGKIHARDLVIATNGYTGTVTPWQRRRIIPIGSYMLATENMDLARANLLMPKQRVFSDTRKIVVYFRRTPDGRRLLFGGRVSVFESDPVKSLPALRKEMLRILPQLEDVNISHTWMGFVGYTFDHLPHLGQQDGIYYAMGYCGSGICLASYLGNRIGLQLLGKKVGDSAFTNQRFQTRPLYSGNPWFLSTSVRYFQLQDKLS